MGNTNTRYKIQNQNQTRRSAQLRALLIETTNQLYLISIPVSSSHFFTSIHIHSYCYCYCYNTYPHPCLLAQNLLHHHTPTRMLLSSSTNHLKCSPHRQTTLNGETISIVSSSLNLSAWGITRSIESRRRMIKMKY